MTIAFVHGVPETAAIWDLIREEFDEPTVALSAPGFGAPLPGDFDISSDGYLNWLAGEVEKLDGPVDIIGHDWGGIHVIRLAMERRELIRCWVSDIIGVFDPDYKCHDLAQAAAAGVETSVTRYRLEEANTALDDLREGRLTGAAVLCP